MSVVDCDWFSFDDQAFEVGANWGASDECKLIAGGLFENIDVFGEDDFDFGDFVGVFGLFVINDDFVTYYDVMEKGEDVFEATGVPRKVGAVAGDDCIAALAGEAGAGIMDDASLESALHFGFERTKVPFDEAFAADANDRNVLVNARDDEAVVERGYFDVERWDFAFGEGVAGADFGLLIFYEFSERGFLIGANEAVETEFDQLRIG